MFDPEGSVLIEGGYSIVGIDVLAAGLVSHLFDKGNDRLLRRTIVPRRQRGGLSPGVTAQRDNPNCGDSAEPFRRFSMKAHAGSFFSCSLLSERRQKRNRESRRALYSDPHLHPLPDRERKQTGAFVAQHLGLASKLGAMKQFSGAAQQSI